MGALAGPDGGAGEAVVIVTAAENVFGLASLGQIFEFLGGRYDYHRLRLARAAIRARQAATAPAA